MPIAAAFALSCASGAEPVRTPGKITVLPEVEVSAARDRALTREIKQRVDRVPGGAQVLSSRSFAPGNTSHFAEALRHAVGVYSVSDNAGEVTKLSIRGSGIQSDETLGVQVLLDGLPYNQGDGEANLEELNLSAIAAAEIHRGGNALRYGGYVLGGAINLLSRTGRSHPGAAAEIEAGSYGYRRGALSSGGATEQWDVFLSASARRVTGFREHSDERAATLMGNVGFVKGSTFENRVYFALSDWERDIPGDLTLEDVFAGSRAADDEALEGDFRLSTRSFRIADKLTWRSDHGRTEAGLLYHYRDFLIHDLYEPDFRLGVTDAHSDNVGLSFSHAQAWSIGGRPAEWVFGFAPAREVEVSHNYRNDAGRIDRSQLTAEGLTRSVNFPVFFESRIEVTDRVSLIAGGQFVWIDRKFDDRFLTDDEGNQSRRDIFRGYNPKFGVLFRQAATTFFANVTRSFQPPSFDDLNPFASGENGSVTYVPLSPQRAWTIEAGSRGDLGRVAWDLSLYHSRLRNELLELNDLSGRDIGTANVPRSIHRGVEFGLEWAIAGRREMSDTEANALTLRQEYMLNDFRFDDHPVYGDNRIGGVPIHLYQLELEWRHPSGFSLSPRLQYSLSRYPADQANTLQVPSFATVGVVARYRRGNFELFVELKNLFDRTHVAMVKPIADAQSTDAELTIFTPGSPRRFRAGVAVAW